MNVKVIIGITIIMIITSEAGQIDPWSASEWTGMSLMFLSFECHDRR